MKTLASLLVVAFSALVSNVAQPPAAFAFHSSNAYANVGSALKVSSEPAPIVLSDVTIVAQRPHRAPAAKVWTCGAPRALAQGSGTVKECEYK